MKFYSKKNNIKISLFIAGMVIMIGLLVYSNMLISKLRNKTIEDFKFRIEVLEENLNRNSGGEVTFIFEKVIKNADFPIIYTDAEGNILYWKNVSGITGSSFDSLPSARQNRLVQIVSDMDKEYQAIPIRFGETVLGYYHYGDSWLVRQLQLLPYVGIVLISLFIGIGYMGFKTLKKGEKNLIWVGMAKETAHQLGTPLSSLNGWLYLLKEKYKVPEDVTKEIEKDLDRLNTVSVRFSQIGSNPKFKRENLKKIVEDTIAYFKTRLPVTGQEVKFSYMAEGEFNVTLNKTLMVWAIENILKNSLDALEGNGGKIEIRLYKIYKMINLEIADNGKGIEFNKRKKIFDAGFTTKKNRGWGLGLSLAKRIVEDYHQGKLSVITPPANMKTSFRIQLKDIKRNV